MGCEMESEQSGMQDGLKQSVTHFSSDMKNGLFVMTWRDDGQLDVKCYISSQDVELSSTRFEYFENGQKKNE